MKHDFSRRKFLLTGSVAVGGLLASNSIPLRAKVLGRSTKPAPSYNLRLGIIGVGMQGSGLLSEAIKFPGIECVAAADLYDSRHTLAREITKNPSLFTTRNYKQLLKRKDIDCIIAAIPDHWHKKIVVDTCNAGKDIYCEKPMSHTAPDGFEMIKAARNNNRILQIGSQRVSSALCRKARELYLSGAIGEVENVELTLGRNTPTGAWQYPPPPDLSPKTLDWDTWLNDAPKIPFNANHFARWRCWKEYGTGAGGDLMVHLISGMMYTLGWNNIPRSASSLGGIVRWKDGRNMPDLHTVLFDYHGVPVYVRLGLGTKTPESSLYMGPKGILEADGNTLRFSAQSGKDTAPSYYSSGLPEKMRKEYTEQWYAEQGITPGWKPLTSDDLYTGSDWDDLKPHLQNFFEAVKERNPVVEDGVFGNHAAIACHMANESYFRQKTVYWDGDSRIIKS